MNAEKIKIKYVALSCDTCEDGTNYICYSNLYPQNKFVMFFSTIILLRFVQEHCCYYVTGRSQESEGSYSARI